MHLATSISLTGCLLALAVAAEPSAKTDAKSPPKAIVDVVRGKVDADALYLEHLYKYLHSHPELSFQEARTAARMAKELREQGFSVTENIGGYGVVGVLENGAGPVVLVRADMDALPVTEETGLDYASAEQARNDDGQLVGVMHACGHDMHMTCWVGTARVLTSMKDRWNGTLVFIAQPAEERGAGARAMLNDGLFERFPKPDAALALHVANDLPHGVIGYTYGESFANVDSVDIVIHGRGGHGAAPHTTIDPIVLAARIVMDLQTLVSREIDPLEPAVVTVGSIHGGTKHNIIPSEVKLQLTVRSYKDTTRKHLIEGIERIVRNVCASARAPEPTVKVDLGEFTPALTNDRELTEKTVAALTAVFGQNNVRAVPPVMGGEDFGRYRRKDIPICMFRLGTMEEKILTEAQAGGPPPPSLHSSTYAPVVTPSIKTGVVALSMAVLQLVGK